MVDVHWIQTKTCCYAAIRIAQAKDWDLLGPMHVPHVPKDYDLYFILRFAVQFTSDTVYQDLMNTAYTSCSYIMYM